MTQSIGDAIAAQIRRYRKLRDMSFVKLAEECSKIAPGSSLTAASLANIERGQDVEAKRRRRDVSLDELLTLAAALRVPPIMIICPIDNPDPIGLLPGFDATALRLMDWFLGQTLPKEIAGGDNRYAAQFERNARPLRLVETFRRLGAEVEHNLRRVKDANLALDSAVDALEQANIALGEVDSTRSAAEARASKDPANTDLAGRVNDLTIKAYRAEGAVQAAAGRVLAAGAAADAALKELAASMEKFDDLLSEMRQIGIAFTSPPFLAEVGKASQQYARRMVGLITASVVRKTQAEDGR